MTRRMGAMRMRYGDDRYTRSIQYKESRYKEEPWSLI